MSGTGREGGGDSGDVERMEAPVNPLRPTIVPQKMKEDGLAVGQRAGKNPIGVKVMEILNWGKKKG